MGENTRILDLFNGEHECVYVEEREPSGRLILPPCLVCGYTAMDALDQLRNERDDLAEPVQ